jgi:hypothetical protein
MTARISLPMAELYETDFVLWTEKNAELLREKNYDAVDWENVIEEIESMGRNDRNAVESLLVQLIKHLLKLAYQESERERNARHWVTEIDEFRSQLEKKLKSTTLANHARDYFEEAYADAKRSLIRTRVFAKDTLPIDPPFSLEQVLDGDWFPIDIDRYLGAGD